MTEQQRASVVDEAKELVNRGRIAFRVGEGLIPEDEQGLYRIATAYYKSGWAPKGFNNAESVFIAMGLGAALGLPPLQSLQSIAVVNGRPAIYGDAGLALCRSKGLVKSYRQGYAGEGDDFGAVVTTQRSDSDDVYEEVFTIGDAKKAGLWGKAGPWTQYPRRMLMFRARGFLLRDAYGDVLCGLHTVEEAQDMPGEPPTETAAQSLQEALGASDDVFDLPEEVGPQTLPDQGLPTGELTLAGARSA